MANIAPPLALVFEAKRAIEKGTSVRQGILIYTKKNQDEFSKQVVQWIAALEQGQNPSKVYDQLKSLHRKFVLRVLERGLRGESIYVQLQGLEDEILAASQNEQARYLAKLPYYLMAPLLLLMFPAFLLLLFGPLLSQFVNQMSSF